MDLVLHTQFTHNDLELYTTYNPGFVTNLESGTAKASGTCVSLNYQFPAYCAECSWRQERQDHQDRQDRQDRQHHQIRQDRPFCTSTAPDIHGAQLRKILVPTPTSNSMPF